MLTVGSVTSSVLQETYFGRKPVSKIQSAMDTIYAKVNTNPSYRVEGSPECKALEKAVKESFDFKSVRIWWRDMFGYGLSLNAGNTLVGTMSFTNREPIDYGASATGYKDTNKHLSLYINLDQSLITKCKLTSSEMVAILLHEIGHNFDYSIWSLAQLWASIFDFIFNTIGHDIRLQKLGISTIVSIGVGVPAAEFYKRYGRGVMQAMDNIDDIVLSSLPSVNSILRKVSDLAAPILQFVTNAITIGKVLLRLPTLLLNIPIMYLNNILTRKSETFADSFSASYGYSDELSTALAKISAYDMTPRTPNGEDDPNLKLFADFAEFMADFNATLIGGHGSTQQRIIRMMDKLEKDINNSAVDPSLRADLQKQYDHLKTTYNEFISLSDDDRIGLSKRFRSMIDGWYNGKSYMFIPSNNHYTK